MKVYTYPAEEWGQGGVRLAGIHVEHVDRAQDADVFVVPQTLAFLIGRHQDEANAKRFLELPYLNGRESRHVVLEIAEHCPPPPVPGVLYFRAGDCGQDLVDRYPSLIPWPWPVDDLGYLQPLPIAGESARRLPNGEPAGVSPGFKWDCGYVGYNTGLDLTPRAIQSCEARADLTCAFERHDEAWGWQRDHDSTDPVYKAETDRRRARFLQVLQGSRVTLEAVAGRGVWRYRFFESWSAGRIPVHIGDGCARPFGSEIDYEELAIFVPESDVDRTGEIVRDWIDARKDGLIVELGRRARAAYENLLHRDRWPELMADEVRLRLRL